MKKIDQKSIKILNEMEEYEENEYRFLDKAYIKFLSKLRYNKRSNTYEFVAKYLTYRSDGKKIEKYLKQALPNLSKEERAKYTHNIYCCRFCDRYFPLWYVSDAEWKKTGKQFERMIWLKGHDFKVDLPEPPITCMEVVPDEEEGGYKYITEAETQTTGTKTVGKGWGLLLCKECYEELFNPEPHYIDIEEFEKGLPDGSWKCEPPQSYFDSKKRFLSVIWDLPALKVPA